MYIHVFVCIYMCTSKGDSLLNGRSSLADLTTINFGQLSFVRKSSLSVSDSESSSLLVLFVFLFFGKDREDIEKEGVSSHLVPTHHRVQQGDVLASGYPEGITSGLGSKCNILRL